MGDMSAKTAAVSGAPQKFSLSERRFVSRVMAYAILLATILCVGGWAYYRYRFREARRTMEESLSAVADLRSDDIRNWVRERRGDADVARFSRVVQDALSKPADPALRAQAARITDVFRGVYGYTAVIVTDVVGKVQLTVPANFAVPESAIAEYSQTAVQSKTVVTSYLTEAHPGHPLYLWLSAPVFKAGETAGDPIGAVLLVSDPKTFIFPAVERRTALSDSARNYLVLRENGKVAGLNQPLASPDGAARAKNTPLPDLASLATTDAEGVFEASDVNGVPLFVAVRNIPDTPWVLLVTIEQDKVLAPLRWDAWNAGIISALLVLATTIAAVLYWRQQKLLYVKRQLEERHRAAEVIAANDRHFRMLIESASDIIMLVNREGVLRFVSPSVKRVLGYEPEELLKGEPFQITHPDDVPKWHAEMEKLARGEVSSIRLECRARHRNGSWRVMQSVGRLLPDPQDDSFMVVNTRDITENRTLEKQFQQAQKMESIGKLAGGIAHDFNNFLSVIIGYCDLLEMEVPPGDKVRRRCEEIKKAGHSAATLTRQLLAFSRQQVLEVRVLDLNATVVNMGKMLRRLIGADIEFTNQLEPALRSIKADPGQIEQVLMNLVVNARDAMPHGGRLVIATANIDFDEDLARAHHPATPGAYVELNVSDNGLGMDAETQSHIFEPFFTTKEQGKGTGLGLATVYGIVKQSGGYIYVYSEQGLGTTFKIYFPVTGEAERIVKTAPVSLESMRGTETVLVVEDQEAIRELVRSFLSDSGYTVLLAADPDEALHIAAMYRGKIHLLLTDLIMPGMNGRELAGELTHKIPGLKVVYMSGYIGMEHRELIKSDEILINKPFTRAMLLEKLREILELQPHR